MRLMSLWFPNCLPEIPSLDIIIVEIRALTSELGKSKNIELMTGIYTRCYKSFFPLFVLGYFSFIYILILLLSSKTFFFDPSFLYSMAVCLSFETKSDLLDSIEYLIYIYCCWFNIILWTFHFMRCGFVYFSRKKTTSDFNLIIVFKRQYRNNKDNKWISK